MNAMEQMNNLPMGDTLAYLEAHARPVIKDPHKSFTEAHPHETVWIYSSDFDFAAKMREVLKQWGGLTPGQLAAVRKCMSYKKFPDGATQYPPRAAEIDLTKVPSGMYAVPNGETRLKVQIKRGTGKWQGWIFVSDGAVYGQARHYGAQKPGETYRGKIEEALRAIAADPRTASQAYGRLTGSCGVCGRHLEDKDSVKRGIGPICADNMGWFK